MTATITWTPGLTGQFATIHGHKITVAAVGVILEQLGSDGLPAKHIGVFDTTQAALSAAVKNARRSAPRHSSGVCTGCGKGLMLDRYPDFDGLVVVGHDRLDTRDWCEGGFRPPVL